MPLGNRRFFPSVMMFAILSIVLCGCESSMFNGGRGPSPVLDAPTVIAASDNVKLIMDAFAADNNIDTSRSIGWYDVSVAGFNFVDDQCSAYFDHLFFLNRERDSLKSILNSANTASDAILHVTSASRLTLAVVAQAFGFGIAATDAVSGTFLYQLPPATTLGFVNRHQTAFRQGVADQARVGLIRTRQDAYHLIQQYLAICLPPNIESELVKEVSGSVAIPDPHAPPGSMSVLNVGPTPNFVQGKALSPQAKAIVRQSTIASGDGISKSLPKSPSAAPLVSDGINNEENHIFVSDLTNLQRVFCVNESGNGKLGPLKPTKSETRSAFDEYFLAIGRRNAILPEFVDANGGLRREGINRLLDVSTLGTCDATKLQGGFEVGRFGIGDGGAKIEDFQKKLIGIPPGVDIPASEFGSFGERTRAAIGQYRQRSGGDATDKSVNSALYECVRRKFEKCPST